MKILIVDDETSIQRLYQQRFRKEIRSGLIELNFAFSGEEALHFLDGGGVNELTMILSDINMPKMSGFELLKIVKNQYPELKVMIITAYSDPHNRDKAFELGASYYLTKPIDFGSLKEKVFTHG